MIIIITPMDGSGNQKQHKMKMEDFKLMILNTGSFAISMTDIDVILKIILLSVSIGYTAQKWYLINKKKKQ